MNEPLKQPCDDCGEKYPVSALTDTMVGYLCPTCKARFYGAARGLVDACNEYARMGQK